MILDGRYMAKEIQGLSELNNVIGYWDVPGGKKEVQGIFQYYDDKIHIKTAEDFSESGFWQKETAYNLLNGFTATGKDITFYGCMEPSMSLNFPGMQQLVFTPTYVFVGKQYGSDDFKLKKISAMFNGLDKWIGQTCFVQERNQEMTEVRIIYTKPEYEKIRCGNKTVFFETDANFHIEYFTSGTANQRTWVSMEFDEPIEWDEAYSELFDYAEFLTLCFGTKCHPERILGVDEDGTSIQIFENTFPDLSQKLKTRFLVPYADIKDQYASVLNNWFDKQGEISPIINYFVEAHTVEKKIKVIPGFLRMVQALESFSRKLRQCTLLPEDEHRARIDRIVSQIGEGEDKEWLSDILSTPVINEPSCQQRMTKLFAEMPKEFGFKSKKLKSLSFKVVTTRNYYTHFNDSLKDKIMDTHGLFYSTTFMKYVLRILLVKELGIDISKVVENIKTDSEFVTAVRELELRG